MYKRQLAILNEYYDVYVTEPADAKWRLDNMHETYLKDMNSKYAVSYTHLSPKEVDHYQRCGDIQCDRAGSCHTCGGHMTDDNEKQVQKNVDHSGNCLLYTSRCV